MSGHSKWANIKRRKEAEDKKRGQVFSKLAKAIVVAVKEGGSADPEANPRLRMVLEQAKAVNMPKSNIERALQRGNRSDEKMESFVLEGYAAGGVGVIIEAISDNRQRTVQELKNLFSRHGGSLAEPGAVSFQFEKRGKVRAKGLNEETILSLLDQGALDFESKEEGEVIFYLPPEELENFRQAVEERGGEVLEKEIVMTPKNKIQLEEKKTDQIMAFLAELEAHEDVQRVFSNLASG